MDKIQVVRLHRIENDGSLKAFVDIQTDTLIVKGLRIVEGKKGLYVAMPQEQGSNGHWYETVFPVSKEVKTVVDEAVLQAYNGE